MAWGRLAEPRVQLTLVLAACAVLGIIVQVHCVDLLTTDGVCYLRMVDYYAAGDFRHAVFGSWSPLGVWLAVPLRVAVEAILDGVAIFIDARALDFDMRGRHRLARRLGFAGIVAGLEAGLAPVAEAGRAAGVCIECFGRVVRIAL